MKDDITKIKKDLLIFFGEFRTFDHVIPLLEKLDQVDIIVSTWSESRLLGEIVEINAGKIYELHPSIKQCNVVDFKQLKNYGAKNNTWKMYYHWKTVINSIENPDEYDNIIFHRTDLLSDWHSVLDLDIEDDVLYVHHDDYSDFSPGPDIPGCFWVNDYYFFGKFPIVKHFVNLLDYRDCECTESCGCPAELQALSHSDMWKVINQNNIKIKKYVLRATLVRDKDIEKIYDNEHGFKIDHLAQLAGPSWPMQ